MAKKKTKEELLFDLATPVEPPVDLGALLEPTFTGSSLVPPEMIIPPRPREVLEQFSPLSFSLLGELMQRGQGAFRRAGQRRAQERKLLERLTPIPANQRDASANLRAIGDRVSRMERFLSDNPNHPDAPAIMDLLRQGRDAINQARVGRRLFPGGGAVGGAPASVAPPMRSPAPRPPAAAPVNLPPERTPPFPQGWNPNITRALDALTVRDLDNVQLPDSPRLQEKFGGAMLYQDPTTGRAKFMEPGGTPIDEDRWRQAIDRITPSRLAPSAVERLTGSPAPQSLQEEMRAGQAARAARLQVSPEDAERNRTARAEEMRARRDMVTRLARARRGIVDMPEDADMMDVVQQRLLGIGTPQAIGMALEIQRQRNIAADAALERELQSEGLGLQERRLSGEESQRDIANRMAQERIDLERRDFEFRKQQAEEEAAGQLSPLETKAAMLRNMFQEIYPTWDAALDAARRSQPGGEGSESPQVVSPTSAAATLTATIGEPGIEELTELAEDYGNMNRGFPLIPFSGYWSSPLRNPQKFMEAVKGLEDRGIINPQNRRTAGAFLRQQASPEFIRHIKKRREEIKSQLAGKKPSSFFKPRYSDAVLNKEMQNLNQIASLLGID